MNPGETYWAASDFGWVVGHSFIVYAPLFHGCAVFPSAWIVLDKIEAHSLWIDGDLRGQARGHPRTPVRSGASSRATTSKRSSRPRPRSVRSARKTRMRPFCTSTRNTCRTSSGSFVSRYRVSHISCRTLFVAGERGDPATIQFFTDQLQLPIVDNWYDVRHPFAWMSTSLPLGGKQKLAGPSARR